MPPISKEDLQEAVQTVKEHMTLVVRPIEKELSELRETVYGTDNDNGLKMDVAHLKKQADKQEWATRILGGGVLTGIGASIVAFVKWLLVAK